MRANCPERLFLVGVIGIDRCEIVLLCHLRCAISFYLEFLHSSRRISSAAAHTAYYSLPLSSSDAAERTDSPEPQP